MHCGASVSGLYGVFALRRQLIVLFKIAYLKKKAWPFLVVIVDVYTGNEVVI